jgi:dihydroorotase
MVGLETSLALALTALYHGGHLSLSQVVALMTDRPSALLGLRKGRIGVGDDGDVVVFDPDQPWVIDRDRFRSKGRNTPFHGFSVRGKVKHTVSGGEIIYQEA